MPIRNFEFWPLRGLNENHNAIFELLGLKHIYFDIHHTEWEILKKTMPYLNPPIFDVWHCKSGIFGFWPLNRGCERWGEWKTMPYLNSYAPKTYTLIYNMQNKEFCVLTSDWRSEVMRGDLWEVKMKNQCHIWTPRPLQHIFWNTSCRIRNF